MFCIVCTKWIIAELPLLKRDCTVILNLTVRSTTMGPIIQRFQFSPCIPLGGKAPPPLVGKANKYKVFRVVCPNVGNPALTSSFTKYKFLQEKNSFATIVNLDCFEIVSAFECRLKYLFSNVTCKVRKLRMTKLGNGIEVRAHTLFYIFAHKVQNN